MKQKRNKVLRNLLILIVVVGVLGLGFKPLLKSLKFGLDLQGGFEVLYEVKSVDGSKVTKDMVTSTYKTIEKRIDVLGVSEPSIIVEGDNKIRVQLAGIDNPEQARELISKAANLTFRDTSDNLLMTSSVLKSGGAKIGQDERGLPAVSLSVKDKETFYKVTKKVSQMQDNRIVIWLDYDEKTDKFANEGDKCGSLSSSKCLSVASVSQGFASDVIIQGNFKQEEVKSLVELINSGSLPTKLNEISSKTVGASFGADSLNKTFVAGVVGISIIVVLLTMIYRFCGFIASVAILVYTFVTLLFFWLVGGVLTLPGIAAMVIGIGMAVDSNVINFARIKDELYDGTKLQSAFTKGNSNSFMAIFDSNITTLLVAVTLFIFGESSIKGFATMLIISIFVTMLIMVFLTRYILKKFVKTGYFDDKIKFFIGANPKDIPNIEKNEKRTKEPFKRLEFVKHRKWYYILSMSMVVIGLTCISLFGLNLSIDFKGGSSITLKTENKLIEENLKKDIDELDLKLEKLEVLDNNLTIITIENTLAKEKVVETENYFKDKYNAQTDIGVVSNIVKKELIKNAFFSLVIASFGILIYISLRFRFSYAVGAIISLLSDAFVVIFLFSVFRLEVSTIFIAAILSILGYSINDTIVTFDRIRENTKKIYKNKFNNFEEISKVVNLSLRQTFMRSIITTTTTIIPVICLILLGSHEIFNFNIALLFGFVFGVYSSLCIASQIWLDIEKKSIGKEIKEKWFDEDDEIQELKIKGVNS